jgi:Protein of unknown function with PCYCGC motif
MRSHLSTISAIGTIVLLGAVAACSTSTDSAPPAASTPAASAVPAQPAPAPRDPRVLAEDLPPLPDGVTMAVRPVEVVRATYEFAARHPEVLTYVPCFCGCERGGHKGNEDCFVSSRNASGRVTGWEAHALGCEICIDVAQRAMQMHNAGASVSAIRAAIDKEYAGSPFETPTPRPKAGGMHDHQ